MRSGSSPHTRGAPNAASLCHEAFGIIPAYAGSTSSIASPTRSARDHPRIRGEHVAADLLHRAQAGIIPAYAGSTKDPHVLHIRRRDHPRIRGEHEPPADGDVEPIGSSPHTRGARHRAPYPAPEPRIIPAYAGSTVPAPTSTKGFADHPRIRGEHVHVRQLPVREMGSSPHTRGARIVVE